MKFVNVTVILKQSIKLMASETENMIVDVYVATINEVRSYFRTCAGVAF